MGLRFRRRVKLLPGVYLNLGKKGVSTTIGGRGAHVTFGKQGTTTTVGLPGTGLSYSQRSPAKRKPQMKLSPPQVPLQPSALRGYLWLALIALIALCVLVGVARAGDQATTTYLCQTITGTKELQDYPCDSSSTSREIPTVHHQPTIEDSFKNMQLAGAANVRKVQCEGWRKSLAQNERDNRVVTNKTLSAYSAQNNHQLRDKIASECVPFGR